MIYYDETMLCDLVPHPEYSRSIHERDEEGDYNRELMSAYENTVNNFMRLRKREIEQITIIDNRKKTLNNKFQISGRKKYIPSNNKPEEVFSDLEENGYNYSNPTQTTTTTRRWASNFK